MSNTITVRRLLPGDEHLACSAVNVLRLEAEGESHRVDVEYMGRFLNGQDNYLIVAYQGETPLGYALAHRLQRFDRDKHMMYIHDVGVAEGRRREGIGKQIINTAARICREEGFIKMFLGTGKNNLPAMKLYLSTGGEPSPEDDPPEGFWWNFEG
jgi:ribosomal protein S18 acetylase RimI-like enzyme